VGPDDAAAEHDDSRRRHARDSAEQNPAPARVPLQGSARSFDRKPAGDLAHRGQKRKSSFGIGDGLVRDCCAAGLEKAARLLGIGRQVEVGEKDLPFSQLHPFRRLRLLHLDDHLGCGEHLGGSVDDRRASAAIGFIVGANPRTRPRLHDHVMARGHILAHAARGQSDPVFVWLDLCRNPDAHFHSPKSASDHTAVDEEVPCEVAVYG
jgi:hypothetical protein